MKKLTPKFDQTTPRDAPNPPFGDPKSMVAKNMIFDELWDAKGATKGPQIDHFRCQKASKNILRNYYKIGIEKA